MDRAELIADVKARFCDLWGYDENLKPIKQPSIAERVPGENSALSAHDFLSFAIEDSASLTTERNRVNCLGNCKRAIDAQLEQLIARLGFLPLAKKQDWKFPKKIEFISDIGVVAPRILSRINRLRNRLEHEFAVPSEQEVQDALDVAILFISYADLTKLPGMNWHFSSGPTVKYDYDNMLFQFYETDPGESGMHPSATLAYGETGFQDFYNFLLKTVPAMETHVLR